MSLLAIPQPYPGKDPWLDLQGFKTNGWQMGGPQSSFNFFGKISANEISLQLHTRGGNDRQITLPLPDELLPETGGAPGKYWTLPAYQRTVGPIVLELHADGTLHIPEWGGGLADGANRNVICQATYVRRAV